MTIQKENEIIQDNDIYFLQVVKDKIIVNNNYEGILILNSQLNVLKKIDIRHDFCIYNAIILNDDEVLFNCIENNSVFVVNINTSEVKNCEMPKGLVNEILMKKIRTERNHVIVKTYKGHFWNLDLQKMIFKKCDNIFEDKEDEIVEKRCKCIEHTKIDNSLIYMNELSILVCKDENEYNILPQMGYRFLGIGTIQDNQLNKLIVLSGSNDNEISVLTSYCIR